MTGKRQREEGNIPGSKNGKEVETREQDEFYDIECGKVQ